MTEASETDAIPLFPLAHVVLFPRVPCPLHIFEPRYRQMTEAALVGEGRIGMVTVRPEHAGAAEMAGDPPVFEVGCEGRIVESQRLDDGRYNLLLMGTRRFRIAAELPRREGRLYRVARIEPLADTPAGEDAERVHTRLERALELLASLVDRASEGTRRFDPTPFRGSDDGFAVNRLCQTLHLDPLEKQGLLEETRIAGRLERLVGLLEFRMAEISGAAGGVPPGAPPTIH